MHQSILSAQSVSHHQFIILLYSTIPHFGPRFLSADTLRSLLMDSFLHLFNQNLSIHSFFFPPLVPLLQFYPLPLPSLLQYTYHMPPHSPRQSVSQSPLHSPLPYNTCQNRPYISVCFPPYQMKTALFFPVSYNIHVSPFLVLVLLSDVLSTISKTPSHFS